MRYYLAIDIGASSGRHILCHLENGKAVLEEIFRFDNGYTEQGGHLYWDTVRLFDNIVTGIAKCREVGKIPVSVGIDTWGVDYALLDGDDRLLDGVFAYRDDRTRTMPEKVYQTVSRRELYSRTGICEHSFNTIFQLACDIESGRLGRAESLLFIPDYLNFLLTGEKRQEYTFASTSGLLDARARSWDFDIIRRLGYPEKLFFGLSQPGERVGRFSSEIEQRVGFNADVILTASHDTASAVLALPTNSSPLYISSGTWSLFGIECAEPLLTPDAENAGFTNEGGVGGTIRFLQNIMGLWIIQSIKRECGGGYSYAQLMELAENSCYDGIFDANDERLLAPANMTDAVRSSLLGFAEEPESIGDILRAAYRSLAACYARAADNLERITKKRYDTIYIVGGGSKDDLLNRLTAEMSHRTVVTGITEATAVGNFAVQLMADGDSSVRSVEEIRRLTAASFDIKKTAYK